MPSANGGFGAAAIDGADDSIAALNYRQAERGRIG